MSRKTIKRMILLFAAVALTAALAGCGKTEAGAKKTDTKDVANDYYIDLTELGMKLTIYLRLDEAGNFTFSNTLDFETVKSSGTFQKTDGEYVMIYDSVNGEEKTASDGLTSSFTVAEDGSLDFTGCDCIYYGSAKATTTSAEHPDAKLIAVIVPEDYDAPSTETDFRAGTYTTADVTKAGVVYKHSISFYEDNTYLHLIRYEKDGIWNFVSETGTYGVNATQLALEPDGADRLSCEVTDDKNLKLSVLPCAGATERSTLDFTMEEEPERMAELTGSGETKEGEAFAVTVKLYTDGSYESTAGDFTETGILMLDSENALCKQYPDHPETAVRGLNQVATVPAGVLSGENGKLTLEGLRVRKSAGLTRYECSVTEK